MAASALKHLTLSVTHFLSTNPGAPNVLASLEGLESLTLTGYSRELQMDLNPYRLFDRLQHLHNLQSLELNGLPDSKQNPHDIPVDWVPIANAPATYTIPALTSLTIGHTTPGFTKLFFELLGAPLLDTLSVKDFEYHTEAAGAFEDVAAEERFPALKTFHISDCCYAFYQEMLLKLERATTLSVVGIAACICREPHEARYDRQCSPPTFERLWCGTGRYLCPKLTELTIEVHGRRHATALKAMLRDRRNQTRGWVKQKIPFGGPSSHILKLTVINCECHESFPVDFIPSYQAYCPDLTLPPVDEVREALPE